jgi:ATP-dependent DNA helicase HFM1/MER3
MQMGSLADPDALRCVSDLPPPFRPVFGFRCDRVS